MIALLLALLAAQEPSIQHRPPRKGEFKPGELSEPDRQKRHQELSGKVRTEKQGAKKTALQRRAEWLAEMEKEHGLYDMVTLVDNGDVAKRVDVVIVSSGYSKADAKKVNAGADALKAGLLKVDPFRNYPDYINFHRINVDDKSGDGAGARIPFKVANNILTCDRQKAEVYGKLAPDYDLVVVMCNVSGVRSTAGGFVITIESGLDTGRTFLHEMGHAFGNLRDEYVETGGAPVRPLPEDENTPWLVNVTRVSEPKLVKWHYWIQDVWPAAHAMNKLPPGHKVGCFEGGALHAKGVWRPEAECLMRMGDKYCVVCFEEVEKQFYRLTQPIDDARPRRSALHLWLDDTVPLDADAIKTMGGGEQIGKFEGFWYLDGRHVHGTAKNLTTTLNVKAAELGAGWHEAGLRVDFSNKRVRRDEGWLSSSRGWKIEVGKRKKPKIEAPSKVEGRVGKLVEFEVKVELPDPAVYKLEARELPEGAIFKDGKFSWTPEKAFQGAWRPRFVVTDGQRLAERSVDLSVLDTGRNFEPILAPMETASVAEGEKLELPIEIVEVDGDNLVFTSPNLPPGAELDVYDGVIRWKPGPSQAARYPGVIYEVWDGIRRVRGTVEIVVEDRPTKSQDDFDILIWLRHWNPDNRAKGLAALKSYATTFRFLEAARLLRDHDPKVRAVALEVLKEVEGGATEAFRGMMAKDIAPHVWHFTDDAATLQWLDELARKVPEARTLKPELKKIENYNKMRGLK